VAFLCALPWLLLTALAVLLASNHGLALLALTAPAFAGAVFQYRRSGLLSGPEAVLCLRVENQQLYARLGSGSEYAVIPADESRLGSRFAALKLRRIGSISGTYPVVLVAFTPWLCNTSPEAFRQLRVWLRLGPSCRVTQKGSQQPVNVQETH
jgi:toxin CptA